MAFTEYLYDKDSINEVAVQTAANLKANRGFSNLESFAIGVIKRRLDKDPLRYRDYGMYWAALKEVLRNHGHDFGSPIFPMVRQVYCGDTDLQTIVMSDEFRKFYLATQAIGTCDFILDANNPEIISFIDDDMEALAI